VPPVWAHLAPLQKSHPSQRCGDVVSYVTTREVAAMSSYTAVGPVIAEGRVFDAVARRDLAGTLDEIADALGVGDQQKCRVTITNSAERARQSGF
jgi:hypothetical protein